MSFGSLRRRCRSSGSSQGYRHTGFLYLPVNPDNIPYRRLPEGLARPLYQRIGGVRDTRLSDSECCTLDSSRTSRGIRHIPHGEEQLRGKRIRRPKPVEGLGNPADILPHTNTAPVHPVLERADSHNAARFDGGGPLLLVNHAILDIDLLSPAVTYFTAEPRRADTPLLGLPREELLRRKKRFSMEGIQPFKP